ncbi:MAG: hypothetical protein OSA93_02975 [Akkermansiaceae bacterium]|jgi:hypothetical protein|nr:hypothetical protein [Akkermansiaceae bacterium]
MNDHPNSAAEFAVFSAKCPHCSEVAEFRMVRKAYQRFGMEFGVEHVLTCSQCQFKKYVDNGKSEIWKGLAKAYQILLAGEASREQFDELMKNLDIPELNELLADSLMWACQCGEESPSNFSECWSCGKLSSKTIPLA